MLKGMPKEYYALYAARSIAWELRRLLEPIGEWTEPQDRLLCKLTNSMSDRLAVIESDVKEGSASV